MAKGKKKTRCRVCGTGVALSGKACTACQRFYDRHFEIDGTGKHLRCESGLFNCLKNLPASTSGKVTITTNGRKLRLFCKRCRFDECQSLGVKVHPSKKKQQSSLTSSLLGNGKLTNPDLQTAEKMLSAIVNGAIELSSSIEKGRLRVEDCGTAVDSPHAAWKLVMTNFTENVLKVKTFIVALPGYADLEIGDRCKLFVNYYSKALITVDSNRDTALSGGVRSANYETIVCFLPEYSYMKNEAHDIWKIFQQWQPTQAEFAFLLALQFYNNDDPRLKNPDMLQKTREILRAIFQAFLVRRYGPVLAVKREEQLGHILPLIDGAAIRRYASTRQIYKRCPELVTLSPLNIQFHDVSIIHPKKIYDSP